MRKKLAQYSLLLCLIVCGISYSAMSIASEIRVELTILELNERPYHRPYIAVWLENSKRQGVHTLAFWHQDKDWFKDLRKWWRKIGRANKPNYDAVSGATKKPGTYTLHWQGVLNNGKQLADGDYVLHIESAREKGSREYLRQKIFIKQGVSQSYQLSGKHELGKINVLINPQAAK